MDYRVDSLPKSTISKNKSEIDISVFFLSNTIKVYETTAVYPIVHLIGELEIIWRGLIESIYNVFSMFTASLGGLAGLFIGCSLIGITEVLYFLLFDIPKNGVRYLRCPKKLKVKKQNIKTKLILVKQNSM